MPDIAPRTFKTILDGYIKRLGYTKTLLFVFIIPFLFLIKPILRGTQRKPLFWSVGLVCLLGWAWSVLLSYWGWWNFPQDFILGIYVLPYLPLEEFIIYPIGGAFSIYFFTLPARKWPAAPKPALHWGFIGAVTAAFLILAIVKRDTRPHYLHSQLVLYNGLCLLLAPVVIRLCDTRALLVSVASLSLIGFVWDYFAFRYGWWVYIAITQVKVAGIPIEDFNFYLMAPTAAISLYLAFCRKMNLPPVPSST